MTYDIAIVGAGAASASALLSLQGARLRTVVIAPQSLGNFRIGESLSPTANQELRELGVLDAFRGEGHTKALSRFSSWGSPRMEESTFWESRQQAGWTLDRSRFDAFLWRRAEQTPHERVLEHVIELTDTGAHWSIQCRSGRIVEARHVLDCSGRSSIVGRQLAQRRRLDKLVAAYSVLDQYRAEVEPTVAVLVEAAPDGWFYSSVVPGGQLVVAWFTDSDLLDESLSSDPAQWAELLQSSEYTGKRIDSAEYALSGCPKIVDASTLVTQPLSAARFLSAGDAAASFDPLSSHGLTTALWSGRKAAGALIALSRGDQAEFAAYCTTFAAGIERYLQDQQRIYSLETRFAEQPFWTRRRPSPQH